MREFDELLSNRRREVDKHLAFIREMETAALNRTRSASVDVEHVNILKSAFLVHLYNVVESVMAKVMDEVSSTASKHQPTDWADGVFRSWLAHRAAAVFDVERNQRVERIVSVIEEAAGRKALGSTAVAKRENGNWSNEQIEQFANLLACSLSVRDGVHHRACIRFFVNNMCPMKYVRHMRNELAHGNLSFIEAGTALSVEQLDDLRSAVLDYMDDVTSSFRFYLEDKKYLSAHV